MEETKESCCIVKKLLSLPPNLVNCFHDVTGYRREEWFCTHDPVGQKLGSGGGSAWLLWQAYMDAAGGSPETAGGFVEWLQSERRILLHAGGQSRRLPAYAPSGKILTPIPVFRWERGQRLSQDLLSLQIPFYEQMMQAAPERLHTMIVSGDVFIRATEPLQRIPDADVVCYGLWLGPDIAKDHGVFVSDRRSPSVLKCMLQKPSVQTLGKLQKDHFYLTDIGVWLLSDRAVEVLMRKSSRMAGEASSSDLTCPVAPTDMRYYDLYGEFGCCLGTAPTIQDDEVAQLKVAILPLPGGEFYHFGTSHELLSSTLAIQNLVNDQREIMHHSLKPHPSMFVQNAVNCIKITGQNRNLWIENSWVGEQWTVSHENIITGVPENDWRICLQPGQCIDVVPIGDDQWVVRPYRYDDKFAGDEQTKPQFPVFNNLADAGIWLERYLDASSEEQNPDSSVNKKSFDYHASLSSGVSVEKYLSAEQISAMANLRRLTEQRRKYRAQNWTAIAQNYEHSVFYQTDLDDAAREFHAFHLAMPAPIAPEAPLMTRIHDSMFRSELKRLKGEPFEADEQRAFGLLREGLTEQVLAQHPTPQLSVYSDQIVWGRSPVRIDISGGWTDTPPFCLMEGGNVVNLAIELNGQPPIQAYVKPSKDYHITLRSIDLGAMELVRTYEELSDYQKVGSPFSIPKAALSLAGFQPSASDTLEHQLYDFGCGIEITLLSAIPAGSGLGTSSLLASTVLGTLNDFCGLGWDKNEIGHRTLVLEQMLTTGGGWQDQFGGLLQGVKLLQTERGFDQNPVVRWLPDNLFTQPEYQSCHLLYYTGITRTAKKILAEIVRKMFLNHHDELALLRQMKQHALDMYEAIQRNDFCQMGLHLRKNWLQNQALDAGTNPAPIKQITHLIDDLCLGYKLPGAGGGGYLYMVAKDPEAAARIRQILNANRLNANARFVNMTLSKQGLQVSRS